MSNISNLSDAPDEGPVLDATIIAQYQRMTHYGITGFGTVAAFSKALKFEERMTTVSSAAPWVGLRLR